MHQPQTRTIGRGSRGSHRSRRVATDGTGNAVSVPREGGRKRLKPGWVHLGKVKMLKS